jgi:LysM repeat protein
MRNIILESLKRIRLNEALSAEEQKELDGLHKELAGFDGVDADVTAAVAEYKTIKPTADKAPDAPAVTANPTANPAKTPYKGSAGSQEIQKLNPAIKDVNKIYPGQALKMPDGSTYTVKPGDTLDKIAKGVKPAEATKMPPAKQQDQIDKAPQAAPTPAATPPAAKPAPAPAAGQKEAPAPFRKELDLDRMKQLSGTPAKPGKLDLSVNNPAMNPVNNAPTKESIRNEDDAILERIRSALKF